MNARQYFHVAKLSLFNVRLLADLQSEREHAGPIKELVETCMEQNNVQSPLSLMHQSTFLAHSYVILVWLREYVWKSFDEHQKAQMRESLARRYDWSAGVSQRWVRDPSRDLTKPNEILHLLRNAIAHAGVDIEDAGWRFSNDDPRNPDADAHIVLTFQQLGAVCDAVMFSYQDVVYAVDA